MNYTSAGVTAVTEDECGHHELAVVSGESRPEHLLIVFENRSRKAVKTAARSLTAYASKRGWCYRPTRMET